MYVIDNQAVLRLCPLHECIDAVRNAMASLGSGDVFQPLRTKAQNDRIPNRMVFMPVKRIRPNPVWAVKSIVVTPDNSERGLDSHQGVVMLHDGDTGELMSIVGATAVTLLRTAAMSVVSCMALAASPVRVVTVLGAGHQGAMHVRAMKAGFPDAEIRVWSRSQARAEAVATANGASRCESIEEAVADADVVCTITSAALPIIRREWLKEGAHVTAAGSSIREKRELDPDTVSHSRLFVDRRESAVNESGEIVYAMQLGEITEDHIVAEIGDVLAGRVAGRRSDSELTVYKSLGLGLQDMAVAELAYQNACGDGSYPQIEWS